MSLKQIKVALVGNPNSGKTTLFNRATGRRERVGNYGGVTVAVKTAHFDHQDYRIELTDLPGTYSISEYTPEELFVRDHLEKSRPDVVVNVVDASNLERNLYLTTQLMDMGLKVVVALNMYDELRGELDRGRLEKILGMSVVPTVAAKGRGIGTVLDRVVEVHEAPAAEHPRVQPSGNESDTRYAFVRDALKGTYTRARTHDEPTGYRADRVLTHKWLGIPLFLAFMWLTFQATFTLGRYPMELIEAGVGKLGVWIGANMADGAVRDLIVDGVIGGVGGVIVFLPNILILFLCISLMEETGYMARGAFIMDRAMHRVGLHGKSFIPMLMGFGCGVPAIMATRTLNDRKDRILTMLCVPFMSCSARLPVYILLISAFFPARQGSILLSIYVIGIALAVLTAVVMRRTVFRNEDAPFVMELPPYRIPTLRNIGVHTWAKGAQYLRKMGTVILTASILVWALGYFPNNRIEDSYIARMGRAIEPAIEPLGFDWRAGVSILTGVAAKEIVVGSMGVLYRAEVGDDGSTVDLQQKLVHEGSFTPLTAYSFMLFVLIYFPCIAALAAIRREAGGRWAIFTALYTTALAWVVAWAVYRIGGMLS